ncbi:septum formation inhibitor-activating ATPase MinD [Bradyrhizobium japonicum]
MDVLLGAVTIRDGDEIRHQVDDVVRAIGPGEFGGVVVDQPAAVPEAAFGRHLVRVIDNAALVEFLEAARDASAFPQGRHRQ